MSTLYPSIEEQQNFVKSLLLAKTNEEARALRNNFSRRYPEANDQSDGWVEPLPLVDDLPSEPYPLDALPQKIREAVEEVQAYVKAPIPLVAASALSTLSLAIQAHVDIQRDDRLLGPTSLFFLTIADSGERKTTCDGFFSKVIHNYQIEQAEEAKPKVAEYRAELAAWEAKRSGLLDAIRKDSRSGKDTGDQEKALGELETQKPQPPSIPRIIRGDETPESLAWALAKEWPSAGVMSSEAGSILGAHAMGRDSIMRNLSLLNVLWDGGVLPIGRKTSESFTVRGVRLTIGLQVQEATLRSFFDRGGDLARGIGFLARFLVSWPKSTQGLRFFHEAPTKWGNLTELNHRISNILNLPLSYSEEGILSPVKLTFSTEAKANWIIFHDVIEGKLKTGGELYDVRDVASKAADNAARLAAIFQVFEHGIGSVEQSAIEGASRIVAWHLNEARRFFGDLALPQELAHAAKLDDWLIKYCFENMTNSIPKRELQQFCPHSIRPPKVLNDSIKILTETNRVRDQKQGRKKRIEVNPFLLRGGEV